MEAKPMMSMSAMTGLLETITAAGGNPDPILRMLGLDRSIFSNLEGFIPSSKFAELLEEASKATGDDCFGLHFGECYNPKNIGPLIYVVLNSPMIAVAIENVGRYNKVHNEAAKWFFTLEGSQVYIRFVLTNVDIPVPRQHNECSMAAALNTLRFMVGSQWAPKEVQFAHDAPQQTSEHLRVFRAPVLFGYETNAFVVDREFFERQIPAADPRLYRIMKRYLEQVLNEMPRDDDLLACVRKAIAGSMRDGNPKLSRVAKSVAMRPRTLQRRLKEYGLEFKELMEDTRRRFALNYLKDRKHTLTEVAFLLGYSEVSAFNRAFKRWTGATPLEYRRKA